jgi:O-antigen ligase
LWQPSPLDLPLVGFGLVLFASAAVSPFRALALGVTLMLVISGVVYFGSFAWLLHHDSHARQRLLIAWALGAVPAALVAVGESVFMHVRAQIPRGVGPNGLGTTLLLGSLLGLGLALRKRRTDRWLWAACALLCLGGLIATESRASLAGWAVGGVYLAWEALRARPLRMAAALAGGALGLAAVVAMTPPLVGRIQSTVPDVSGNRVRIWRTSLSMIAAHPLLGTGFGTFERAYSRVKGPDMSPEPFAFNLWLNLAVETGLPGLVAALTIAGTAVRVWRRGRGGPPDPMRPIISALWAGLLVDQFADNTLFSISTSAAPWFLLALVIPK